MGRIGIAVQGVNGNNPAPAIVEAQVYGINLRSVRVRAWELDDTKQNWIPAIGADVVLYCTTYGQQFGPIITDDSGYATFVAIPADCKGMSFSGWARSGAKIEVQFVR